ncbi:plastocyanin/azurin family copper-binding protein [Haloarchaeobius sp. DYHT-AS-18]|uniref:plastocyanin/azurin family copper-binding protein n=1 Tax=Haloarchaeobius sp. DYHT-AS-18 TaxID=3446117 RepID=UPI003EB7DC17
MDRRRFIHASGAAALAALAGCSGQQSTGTVTETATDAATDTATKTQSDRSAGSNNPPGADVLGGPDDRQSSAEVSAAVLDGDQGAGQFVFTPSVVFIEAGATVTWQIEGMPHSVTAYHEGNGTVHRVPDGAPAFDSGTISAGETFEHTFETEGVHNYFCKPHKGLGMVGIVVVGSPQDGPGTTQPADLSGAEAAHLTTQLQNAGIMGAGGENTGPTYDWIAATWDSYWYSLYNMSTNIAMSGNGVQFPHNEEQQAAADERIPAMLKHADTDKPPIKNPNLNMAPFTTGVPHFTQQPVFDSGDGRPDAATLKWDMSKSSKTVSPASLGWTHLKGVTWAKNFQNHFDSLPPEIAAKFRAQVLTTLAQIGVKATLIAGGPHGNGALTQPDGSFPLISGFDPTQPAVVAPEPKPTQHAAMLWFLSDLTSLAQGDWFGYVNPEPLIPAEKIQMLTDGVGTATMDAFSPDDIVSMGSTRDLGLMLGAMGWYGTHAGSAELEARAATYAENLAAKVEANVDGNGKVSGGAANQAATQGIVGQGLLWASEIDGVDFTSTGEATLGYMADELFDAEAGTYMSAKGDSAYRITARDAGDITGGVNAADAVLGMSKVREQYASFYDQTFNRGRLQRAERPPSRDENAEHTLPLPPKAGGEFGQAAVYNAAVEYDTQSDSWSVVDDTFDCEQSLYLSNQDIWISQWGGTFFQGRGVPGQSDTSE